MAAVAKTDAILVSPPGENRVDKGYCAEAVVAGDPVIISNQAPPTRQWEQVIVKATGTVAHGIALKDCGIGGTVEYALEGEMDGFVGLTRGAALTIATGAIDDTAPGAGVEPRFRVVTPTRIRFTLL